MKENKHNLKFPRAKKIKNKVLLNHKFIKTKDVI